MSNAIAVLGVGVTGLAAVRHLVDRDLEVAALDPDDTRRSFLPPGARGVTGLHELGDATVAVVATPPAGHVRQVERLLRDGRDVVSLSDEAATVDALLALDDVARALGRRVIVGAGFCPGISEVLAVRAARDLTAVDAVAIATTGTAGPACARVHHAALKRPGREWLDGAWHDRIGGSGRDLVWFPEPIGARDCYRGSLTSPTLLHRSLPDARRLTARMSATRRDRLTSRLPMLRPPHADGGPGAVRVEVRGWAGTSVRTEVLGMFAMPSRAAGTFGAIVAERLARVPVEAGVNSAVEVIPASELLADLHAAGLAPTRFEGASGA